MKNSYLKILLYNILIVIIAFINSFVSSILREYGIILFLLMLIISFKFILGFEKDRHRYTKDVIFEILICIIIYYLIYYVGGIFFGFVKSGKYYNFYGITRYLIPMILNIILIEFFRYNLLLKSSGNKFVVIMSFISLVVLDSTNSFHISSVESNYDVFMFVATALLPIISVHLVCSYLVFKCGYKPNIVMRLLFSMVMFLMPIFPYPSDYIRAVINFVVPIIIGYVIYNYISKYEFKKVDRDYYKKKFSLISVPTIVVMILVYFVCGYFKYYAIAVASGSMRKYINKGDVVIVEQLRDNYNILRVGDVIAYRRSNVMVVHRIVRVVKYKNEYYFYTKGDANKYEDNFKVDKSNLVGVVRFKLNKIGYPTIWLNEL